MGAFDRALERRDAARLDRVMRRLRRAGLNAFAVTGGVALALQMEPGPERRRLNDLDLVIPCLQAFPPAAEAGLLVNHIHPDAQPGRLLVQLVDPLERLRIDVFGAVGDSLRRAKRLDSWLSVLAIEDLLARIVRGLLSLDKGEVPAKLAADFDRLGDQTSLRCVQAAWRDHRPADAPETFADAAALARALIDAHPGRLIVESYVQARWRCPRCADGPGFPLASEDRILAAIGYL